MSFIDELDAKMNSVARERMTSQSADGFTDRIFALDNRRFYKGIPEGSAVGLPRRPRPDDRSRSDRGGAPPTWRGPNRGVRMTLESMALAFAP